MTTAGKDNLTRVEALQRAKLIGDVTYDIKLDLRLGEVTFESSTVVKFACKQPGASTFIDLDAVELSEVTLNGRTLDIKDTPDGRIPLDGLEASNELIVHGICEYSRTGTGLHRTVDPVDKRSYTYTQFEPFDAHRVFACFDQPDLKGTFAFEVDVPEEWVVISNNRPSSQPAEGKSGTWVFDATPVMSTYLGAICAGPYVGVFDKAVLKDRSIELGWWSRQSLAKYVDADELFEITKQGFDFYEELFDYPYMLDNYDQVFCPEYKFGAMENLGCVTYTENYLFRSKVTEAARESRAETILHEMAHMWFGDLVTMKWWNDLWLNESFATYVSYVAKERATRFTNSWVSFASGEKMWAYRQDQLPTTHPIVADIPDVDATHLNFDRITYAKGASVLKQLAAWVGEDAFFKGLRKYFKRHEWGNTELPDFLGPLEEESGRDLTAWSNEWLETAGVNTIKVEGSAVVQEAPKEWPTIRSHRIGIGLFDTKGDELVLRRDIETDIVGERSEVAELASEAPADLILPNYRDLAYAKIRFDERSLETLTARLRVLTDPLSRTLCWGASWDMVRDAQTPARRYLDLVLNNIDGEDDIGVVGDLLGNSGSAVSIWSDLANRTAVRTKLCTSAREHVLASEAGSDFQLTWARWYVATARTDDDVKYIRGLLDGTEVLKGLEIDTDLRWQIVSSLARIGACDDELIAAEFERDPTDQGERYAAGARASRPTPEAKAEAWERVMQDPELTLAMIRAILTAFQPADQEELTRPYADRYFEELLGFWERRELDLGLSFTGGAYPRQYMQDVLDKTDKLLGLKDLPPQVRRILTEQKDESARVMRARAADARA